MMSEKEFENSGAEKNTSVLFVIAETLASVKFGISLLGAIVAVSIAGMIVPQRSVAGFERFYAQLSPAVRDLSGALGLFDVYGSWYYAALLGLLALNIVLASVERFLRTWRLVRCPHLDPSRERVLAQNVAVEFETAHPDVLDRFAEACRRNRLRRIVLTENGGSAVLFAESGVWNRFGAYAVHIGLLVLLLGGVVSALFSVSGQVQVSPGERTARISEFIFREGETTLDFRSLPFSITCIDLEQRLIDPDGPLDSANSIDWITRISIEDGSGPVTATISLNRPIDHRGYRIFHSGFMPIGKARTVTLRVGDELAALTRNGTAVLSDGTILRFVDFRANLKLNRETENENSSAYENPAAIVEATAPDGRRQTLVAVRDNQPGDREPVGRANGRPVRLIAFERVSDRHILFVRHDPGSGLIYAGSILLVASLFATFLFSHRRVWCRIERLGDGRNRVTMGGDANRDLVGFSDVFRRVAAKVQEPR